MKKIRKLLNVMCFATMLTMMYSANCLAAGETAESAGDSSETTTTVEINETNFPDSVFRNYILTNLDANKNGILDNSENIVSKLSLSNKGISSLKGIEYLDVAEIDCSLNHLTELDVSKNVNLTKLDCHSNSIASINLSNNENLTFFDCDSNNLSELDVTNLVNLVYLYCGNYGENEIYTNGSNSYTTIDLSANTKLQVFDCKRSKITALDLSNNSALTELDIDLSPIASLDVSNNSRLSVLNCTNCGLYDITFGDIHYLRWLRCNYNNLTTLDLSKFKCLNYLQCCDNNLTSLVVPRTVTVVWCGRNELTNIDLSACTALMNLDLSDNDITEIDLSVCTALTNLNLSDNDITEIDLSSCTGLEVLSVESNNISELDVSICSKLESLTCSENPIADLDVSNNSELRGLNIGSSVLTSLNLGNNTEITLLSLTDINSENLIDISSLTKLWTLSIYNSQIGYSLDLTKATGLKNLTMKNNSFAYLKLRGGLNTFEYEKGYCPISLDVNGRFDLSTIPGFDVSKASNWKGCTIKGNIITFNSGVSEVTYSYRWNDMEDLEFGLRKTDVVNPDEIQVDLDTPVLKSIKNNETGVTVSWNQVAGASKYRVFRKTSSTGWSKVADTTGTSYTDTTATSGTKYTYTVRCINSDATKYLSDYNHSGISILYLKAVLKTDIKAVINANNVTLSWPQVAGASGYYVYRKTGINGTYSKVATKNGASLTSYKDSTVVAGTTYYYAVRAYNGSTLGNYSSKQVKFLKAITGADFTLSNAETGVKITWSAVTGADGYYVYRKTGANGIYSKIKTVTSGNTVTYTDTTASSGTTYYYAIRAYSGDSVGNYSAKSIYYLKAILASDLKLSNVTTGVKVSWSSVNGATSYRVYRKQGANGSYKLLGTTSSLSFTDATPLPGKTYYYAVRAMKGSVMGNYTSKPIIYLKAITATDLTLTNTSTGISVKWYQITGASGYYVYRKTASGSYAKIATISGNSTITYLDTAVQSSYGTTYTYAVRAFNGSTLGDYGGKSITRSK